MKPSRQNVSYGELKAVLKPKGDDVKRILMVERLVRFAVAVTVEDGKIKGTKVLTSATEAKMLLEQAVEGTGTPVMADLGAKS